MNKINNSMIWTNYIQHKNYQLMSDVKQNIVICQWWADKLFAEAEKEGKNTSNDIAIITTQNISNSPQFQFHINSRNYA